MNPDIDLNPDANSAVQIRSLCLVELTKLAKAGFPYNKKFSEFYDRFRVAVPFSQPGLPLTSQGLDIGHLKQVVQAYPYRAPVCLSLTRQR